MSDLVHPNVEGYRVLAQNWFEAIEARASKDARGPSVVAQNWFEAIEALLSTAGESTVAADVPTLAESSAGLDKWSLWTGETQLRGANIYQRRVYPELDGPSFLGSAALGPLYTQKDSVGLARV